MASSAAALPAPSRRIPLPLGGALGGGFVAGYLSLIVLLPLAALAARAGDFSAAVQNSEAVSAMKLTLTMSLAVTLVNAVIGTIIAWVLVRDSFRGQGVVNALIDLPFALPTIVAGLVLIALYGPNTFGAKALEHVHIENGLMYTRWGVLAALLFVTLPFVVRTVQPVLLELDRDMEEAAACLGASRLAIFRRIIFPNLLPAILSGVALAFARAVGEFGSVVLISGNLPFKTEVASVYVFGRLQSGDTAGSAALSVVLLVISFAILLAVGGLRRGATRHDRPL